MDRFQYVVIVRNESKDTKDRMKSLKDIIQGYLTRDGYKSYKIYDFYNSNAVEYKGGNEPEEYYLCISGDISYPMLGSNIVSAFNIAFNYTTQVMELYRLYLDDFGKLHAKEIKKKRNFYYDKDSDKWDMIEPVPSNAKLAEIEECLYI